jgi:hypothetical protein
MTALRFPAEIAVGEVWWKDAREPSGWGHLLAIGVVEVPDGTAVSLSVYTVAEVSVSTRQGGLFAAPAGTWPVPAFPLGPARERVTWQRGMPDGALRNNRSIWGGHGEESYSVGPGDEAVDLEFIRGLPEDSKFELSLTGDVVPVSFTAVAHLAPGLRGLGVYLDNLGDDAPSVIAKLTALESLRLYGHDGPEDGPSLRLDDHALSVIADLPALESLSLLGGSYTEHGLQQLRRLPQLRHLHIEREGLMAPMFRFAAAMPALTRLTGLDEFGHDGPGRGPAGPGNAPAHHRGLTSLPSFGQPRRTQPHQRSPARLRSACSGAPFYMNPPLHAAQRLRRRGQALANWARPRWARPGRRSTADPRPGPRR